MLPFLVGNRFQKGTPIVCQVLEAKALGEEPPEEPQPDQTLPDPTTFDNAAAAIQVPICCLQRSLGGLPAVASPTVHIAA